MTEIGAYTDIAESFGFEPVYTMHRIYGPEVAWKDSDAFDEPDLMLLRTPEKLWACVIRIANFGHLCGYAEVPQTHPMYCNMGEYMDMDIVVHGGITYADDDVWFAYSGCSVARMMRAFHKNPPKHWVGFDCAHGGDLSPGKEGYGEYRNFAYVLEQTSAMCAQLTEQSEGAG